jgi:hypothetical protein
MLLINTFRRFLPTVEDISVKLISETTAIFTVRMAMREFAGAKSIPNRNASLTYCPLSAVLIEPLTSTTNTISTALADVSAYTAIM